MRQCEVAGVYVKELAPRENLGATALATPYVMTAVEKVLAAD